MNLIFIVVDALRQDVLNRLYQSNQLNGGLKFLLDNGFVCEDTYATGCPTQFSFPSIFTSTLPLDFGGYDFGILKRPKSFPEILADNDYKCIGIAACPWEASLFGYNRGFSIYYNAFDINTLIISIINDLYSEYYKNSVVEGRMSLQQAKELRKAFITFSLPFVEEEVLKRVNNKTPAWIYPWGYTKSTLNAYIEELMHFKGSLNNPSFNVIKCIFPILKTEHSACQGIKPSSSETVLNKVIHKLGLNIFAHYNYGYVYSKQLLNNYLRSFPLRQGENQFQFIHILDVHETLFSDHKYQFNYKTYLSSYSYEHSKNYYYEESIKKVDQNLGNYCNKLLKGKHARDTSIVLIGDHGSYWGYPNRGFENRNASDHLYHESLNCAMIFYSPKLKPSRYRQPCSLIDLAPSILDLLGLKPDSSFVGRSIFQSGAPRVIISENCGTGPCHLSTKPIYLSIKKPPYKLIYREFFHPNERFKQRMELYEVSDVYESNDLVNDRRLQEFVSELEDIAVARIAKVRNYSRETAFSQASRTRLVEAGPLS